MLLLGVVGERIVNHFSFYAAFATPEEWRLVSVGRPLGTIPVTGPLIPGMLLIFAGKRWRITNVDAKHMVVDLLPAPGGKAPRFSGGMAPVHDMVRTEMLALYRSIGVPAYLDQHAADLLAEARQNFLRFELGQKRLLEAGSSTYLFLWTGDRIADTVVALLGAAGLDAVRDGLSVSVGEVSPIELTAHFTALLAGDQPDPVVLAGLVAGLTEAIAIRPIARIGGSMGWVVTTLGVGIFLQGFVAKYFGSQALAFPSFLFSPRDHISVAGVRLSAQYLVIFAIALALVIA
ncbi:MAG: hypothetical protein WCO88_16180, partial [Actinomycetota bacterium]